MWLGCLSSVFLTTLLASFSSSRAQAPPSQAPGATVHPSSRITGHVLCADTRRPARGALVTVIPYRDARGQSNYSGPDGERITRVSDDGGYSVEHLEPGVYVVIANLSGYLSGMDDLLDADPELQPSEKLRLTMARQTSVSLLQGGTGVLDLLLQRGAALSGRVVYSDGAPAVDIKIILEDASQKPVAHDQAAVDTTMTRTLLQSMFKPSHAITDDQGDFRLAGVRAGSYRLAALANPSADEESGTVGDLLAMAITGFADPRALHVYAGDTVHAAKAKKLEVHSGEDISGITLTFPVDALHRVQGTVMALDGRPINMGKLTLADTTDPQLTFEATPSIDGEFSFHEVPAGTYTISATDAHIGEYASVPSERPERNRPMQPIADFGDQTTSVLVQSSDVNGVKLVLKQTPASATGTAKVPVE